MPSRLATVLLLAGLAGCAATAAVSPEHRRGILLARPTATAKETPAPGLHKVRGALLYVPEGLAPDRPAPLLVVLHGAGGRARGILSRFGDAADRDGMILLAPLKRGYTWDLIADEAFSYDLAEIDAVLTELFASVPIDPERVAVAGFSDGASYALSMGLGNGALFRAIIAIAPGFAYSTRIEGRPRIFIAHGTFDERLPIDTTSRRIVPMLRQAGLQVRFVEFAGVHRLTPPIVAEALAWLRSPPERPGEPQPAPQ